MGRILIIDDDVGVRGVLQVMLTRAGYDVVAADCGEEGLRQARAKRPDLVLLDVEMPGMNGFDVCSIIKTDTTLCAIPVIIMTGRPVAGIPARAQAVGAVELMLKPFDRDGLLKRIAAHVPAPGRS